MGALRLHSVQRTARAQGGGIGSSLLRLGKAVAPKLVRSIPGVGTVAGVVGAGAAVVGAVSGARSAARAVAIPLPGGGKLRPLAGFPGGVPLFTGKPKRKRMNPANSKALTRAIRRIKGAEKLFRKVLQVQGKPAGGIRPKRRK